jgi:hypothetical protein
MSTGFTRNDDSDGWFLERWTGNDMGHNDDDRLERTIGTYDIELNTFGH